MASRYVASVRRVLLSWVPLALAACSGPAPPPLAAPTAETAETVLASPVEPDFDATKNAFYRECMLGQHDIKQCVCTTRMLKAGVDADIYQSMFASGMSAVIPLKGKASEMVNAALSKAFKQCRPQ